MFDENLEQIEQSNRSASIPGGDYSFVVTGVRTIPAASVEKHPQIVASLTVEGGEYEGTELPYFVPLSPKAAGIRAKFYRAIGYVPSGSTVDENEWIGLKADGTVTNQTGDSPKVQSLRTSRNKPDTESVPF